MLTITDFKLLDTSCIVVLKPIVGSLLHTMTKPSPDWVRLTLVVADGAILNRFVVGSLNLLRNLDEIPTKHTDGNAIR